LLLALCGLLTPQRGAILFNNTPVHTLTHRAQHIGLLPQHATTALPLRARDIVAYGRYPYAPRDPSNLPAITQALHAWHLQALLPELSTTLSGGEQQRLRLASLFAQSPELFLLDEPTNHLDSYYQYHCLQQLRAALSRGKSIIVATHDILFARALTSRTLLLDTQPATLGATDSLLSEAAMTQRFQHLMKEHSA
jgi:iron complex transport system ATP-binding protein